MRLLPWIALTLGFGALGWLTVVADPNGPGAIMLFGAIGVALAVILVLVSEVMYRFASIMLYRQLVRRRAIRDGHGEATDSTSTN